MIRSILKVAAAFTLLLAALGLASNLLAGPAHAGKYCTATQSCKAAVASKVDAQNKRVRGTRWKLSRRGCSVASREQEANQRRCQRYDRQRGGKTLAQCAKCYRQAVFDAARWKLCHSRGWAPPVPRDIYRSIARLGKQAVKRSR